MQFKTLLLSILLLLVNYNASADLEPWKDYDISDEVWAVTSVRVKANMDDTYLEGLKNTWVASARLSRELDQIENCRKYRSDLLQSGEFNLMLMIKLKDTNALAPSKEKYDAFMKQWGEKRDKEMTEYTQKNYPDMRVITGQYNMREIRIK